MICEKNIKEIKKIVKNRKNMETPLMMILSDIQYKYGYISLEVQQIVASELNIPVSEVYQILGRRGSIFFVLILSKNCGDFCCIRALFMIRYERGEGFEG